MSNLGDATIVRLSRPAVQLATTTDLVHPVCSDMRRSGQISASHALSDLYAVLSIPAFATVTLGWGRDLDVAAAADLLHGVADVLEGAGCAYAGGHTVRAEHAYVSLTVTGVLDEQSLSGAEAPAAGDVLCVSRPLGSGIALSALQLGLVSEPELEAILTQLTLPSAPVADHLRRARAQDPSAVTWITDITGFGLVHQVHRPGLVVEVDIASVPFYEGTVELARLGASTSLGDQNLLESLEFCTYIGAPHEVAEARVLLNDPQTSGPLLFAVDPSALASPWGAELLALGCTAIGCVNSADEGEGTNVLVDCRRA